MRANDDDGDDGFLMRLAALGKGVMGMTETTTGKGKRAGAASSVKASSAAVEDALEVRARAIARVCGVRGVVVRVI